MVYHGVALLLYCLQMASGILPSQNNFEMRIKNKKNPLLGLKGVSLYTGIDR
jgi:hypothetical protein